MAVILAQIIGVLVFTVATVLLGVAIRRNPTRDLAAKTSRISHILYWIAVVLPYGVGLFYPGLSHYDTLLKLPHLPWHAVMRVAGFTLMLIGAYYTVVANILLFLLGRGTATFKETQHVVEAGVYRRLRHPMSLGYYLVCIGLGLLAGSTGVTAIALLLIIPAHIFNLKYFEEQELAARYGAKYQEYKAQVPFLFPRLRTAAKARAATSTR